MPSTIKLLMASALLLTPAAAQAAAPNDTPSGVSAQRAAVIKDCVAEGAKLSQRDYGVRRLTVERACMVRHGEIE